VRRLFRLPIRTRAEARADADAELDAFLHARVEQLVARGMDPDAARAEALRRLGGASADEARRRLERSAERREGRLRFRDAVDRLRQDLRVAARQLRAAPGFTLVAALTLALGVGASTAIFSAVNPILLEPLPYPEPGQLVTVWDVRGDGARLEPTFGTYRELVERSRSLASLTAIRTWQPTLTGPAEPERLDGQRVTAAYFRVLGVRPALGRDFTAEEDLPGSPRVAVLAHSLWRRRFGADPAIVGRHVTLDGLPHTVVGVMPPEFENVLAPAAVAWTPLRYEPSLPADGREWGHHLALVGRLRAGERAEAAARDLRAIAARPVPRFARAPWASLERGLTVHTLRDEITAGVRPALLAVLGAVTLLLVIACVNVASLLLARGRDADA
jgi:putative ABC transport system permease protein